MPNKPHAPRNKAGKKPVNTAATANGEDTSFIVFSNSKDSKKTNKNGPTKATPEPAAPPPAKGKNAKGAAPVDGVPSDAPKKPDTRTLVSGSSSWTGKLPLNLLSEHCQKQKWDKPEYTMGRSSSPPGFYSTVILRHKNPKTQEMTTLPPIALPKEKKELGVRETAVEARHFAAAYALFRVANAKNLHMMMPPQFRDLWKYDFAEMKREAERDGAGWLYEADPFAARERREEEKRLQEKRRLEREKKAEAEKKEGVVMAGGVKNKGWSRAPKVEMGKRMRREVEGLVRRDGVWNPHRITLTASEKGKIVAELSNLGFRKAHVEEAADICKDREEVLEWLLIHVPEDDLPKWSLPEGYSAGVSLASGDLQREGKLKRLAGAGYALELCEETLDACSGDEALTAEALQNRLLGEDDTSAGGGVVDGSTTQPVSTEVDSDVWAEEQTILGSIFGERYQSGSKGLSCRIKLEVADQPSVDFWLHAQKPSSGYPETAPVLGVTTGLPAYIRLSILKQCLLHAKDSLVGEQMIFNIVDWLEHEIPNIISNPGRLSSIASASSTTAEIEARTQKASRFQQARRKPKPLSWTPASAGSQRLLADWQAKQSTPAQKRMLQARQSLPAWQLQGAIVKAVTSSQVTIISGETGSGKSTQSVQFVLDDLIKRGLGEAANVICTQPRRISALGLADRVADERCGKVGDEVGYAIRGESRQKAGMTKITFVTTGVLLRRLQTSGGKPQDVVDALADVSHVVIDEVHERSLDTDFLMVLLRDVLKVRKDLKLILMSATLDAGVFERYFSATSTVSRVEIQGRTHPVQDLYLDDVLRLTGYGGAVLDDADADGGSGDANMGAALRTVGMRINYDLIAQTVQSIDAQLGSQDGGILIFLPGVAEIDRTLRALQALPNIYALPLHASLQPAEQKRVFPPAPAGKRKVVAATNVAETSITIEDIVAVIDTGRVKETSFDPQTNMVKLEEVWASRAACKQRRGRAGRVRAGTCYKLYTRNAETSKMAERPEPEIRRVPLEQLCLSVKAMGVADVPAFLASALTPPETLAVEGAITLLQRMGALDGSALTALGRHLSMIPADLRCGKLLVYGATFGCLEACLTIASILTVRSPFISPQAKRDEAKAARAPFGDGHGDLIADLRAYEQWSEMRAMGEPTYAVRQWCEQNFLSHQTLHDISTNRAQYLSSLQEIGFLPQSYRSRYPTSSTEPSSHNRHNTNLALLRAVIAGSFNPQMARIEFPDTKYAATSSGAMALDPEARTIKYFNQENGRVFVHPSSSLFDAQSFPGNSVFVSYFTKMATSKVFVRDLTPFNAYGALLFSGPIELDTGGRGLLVDGWMRLKGWARIGVLVSRLRMMLDEALEKKIDEPGLELVGNEVVDVVRRLVELDGLDR
ncbi:putative ATP-dependent RNA helicase ucp12 [Taxawa tesnikishii (nom. ined.)]|nr:putative ATP-dependent RNA helicase ucp12 [Dothideales sp. JES 119]